ncbi:Ras-responsive element-binding protein 1 [Fukomys damarensis]|uniref:Ras-responsive element-binding protein 1 n=1 Tax=Fukomys damarensis TaxID=885580 RepID=A0A091EEJ0_FUKDA|nr:Ras-responsive element-binding protein 1 [Fukomys damarensis]
MTSSPPVGLEGSDLSSINTMMSAVMNVGNVAENGGSPQGIKPPSKPPGPNRIGRRNQETKEEKSSYNCPLCEKICTTQHQLTMHIRQHNTDTGGADHSCSICGKSLSSASSLDRHMLVHSGERPYKCTVCGQSFTTNGNMHRHMKIHEKDPSGATAAAPPSPLKRRRLSSKRKLSHDAEAEREDPAPVKKMVEDGQSGDLERTGDEVFHCPVCFKEFVCKYGLESHMETHSDNPLRCDICCVTFRTHRGLLRHNALVHKQLPRDAMGRPFIQNNPSIPAGFHDLGFMDFSCRKFPRISQAWCETNLRRCISEQHRFICDTCDKAFPMLSSLALHKQTHVTVDRGREELQADVLAGDALDQKVFLALLGLQHTKDVRSAPTEEPLPDDSQAIQLHTLKCPLPQDPGCTGLLSLSAFDATSLGGSLTVLPAAKEGMKHLSLQPFQKGFIIQPDSSIVVKPISGEAAIELADIQQILKMAASAPPQISLPPLSKAPATPLQAIFKHMPPLKPKPLVTPRTVVATSTPPPLINAQASPGCISPSLPPPPLKLLKGSVEAAATAHLLQSKSGAQPNSGPQLFLQPPRAELPGQPEMKTQLEQDSIIEALLPLSMEAKIKQEITEGDLKAIMTGPSGKKAPPMRKVLYPCRFCNQVFAFSGVLRAHVRSHLGISPYQCNICDYIAADKAALIRHLRTHSGERPYICKICHYPFTVKANCERHLRKKHLKATRKDIEKNIEYVSGSAAELVDAFCAPDTPLDFSQKGLALVQVKQENVAFLGPYDCSMEPIDLSIPKNCRKGDKDAAAPGEAKKPEQEGGGATQLASSCSLPGSTLPPALGPSGIRDSPAATVVTTTAPLDPNAQPLQGSVQLAVPIYSPALVSSPPVLGSSALLSSPTVLRPLRPKPPLLLPKPSVTEELPPLASIAQIISSVSSAPTLLKTKVADPGPGPMNAGGSSTAASDSLGGASPGAAARSPKEQCSDPAPVAGSPEAASPTEQGPTDSSRKRGRKRGARSQLCVDSVRVDLDSSGEFASVEKMLATTDTNKFSPFLQTAEDDAREEAAGGPGDPPGPSDEEQGGPPEDRLLRAKRNSYANCLQKVTCPHCPRAFPWASSLQRHMLTHTGESALELGPLQSWEGASLLLIPRVRRGERPYKCQTCERTFTLKHSLVRHQRIHQKARHGKQQHGKDSDRDERAEEDSEGVSENEAEAEAGPGTSGPAAVTRSNLRPRGPGHWGACLATRLSRTVGPTSRSAPGQFRGRWLRILGPGSGRQQGRRLQCLLALRSEVRVPLPAPTERPQSCASSGASSGRSGDQAGSKDPTAWARAGGDPIPIRRAGSGDSFLRSLPQDPQQLLLMRQSPPGNPTSHHLRPLMPPDSQRGWPCGDGGLQRLVTQSSTVPLTYAGPASGGGEHSATAVPEEGSRAQVTGAAPGEPLTEDPGQPAEH